MEESTAFWFVYFIPLLDGGNCNIDLDRTEEFGSDFLPLEMMTARYINNPKENDKNKSFHWYTVGSGIHTEACENL